MRNDLLTIIMPLADLELFGACVLLRRNLGALPMLVPALGTFLHSPCTSELLSSEEHLKLPVHWHRHLCQLKAMLILSVRVRLLNCNTLHFIKSIYVTLSLRRLTSVIWLSSLLQNNIQGSQRLCLSLSPLLFLSLSLPVSVSLFYCAFSVLWLYLTCQSSLQWWVWIKRPNTISLEGELYNVLSFCFGLCSRHAVFWRSIITQLQDSLRPHIEISLL